MKGVHEHLIRGYSDQGNALVPQDDEIILTEQPLHQRNPEHTFARLRLLWAHRRFLGKALAVGLVVFAMTAFLIPSSFDSTVKLMPPDQQSGGLGILAALAGRAGSDMGGTLTGIAGDVLGLKTSSDLFIGVLESRTVQDDIISKFNLRKVYSVGPWNESWESARKTLESRTDVSSDRKSGIISIKVTDRNPRRAAAIAQEYVTELNRVVTTLNTSAAHRERVFLEGRLAEVKQDLESAEKDFSEFASKNTAIDVPQQGRAMIAAAAELEGQLIAMQSELEALRSIYTDNNARVQQAQARVDELRRQLGKIAGQPGQSSSNGQDVESGYPSIRQLPLLGVSYADLYRRIRVEEAVFETLTQEYELAKVQEAKETPSVKVLDPADVPERKSGPPRLIICLAGMLFVGVLAATCVFGMEDWRRTDPQNPGKALALEVIESIRPYVPLQSSNSAERNSADALFDQTSGRQSHKAKIRDGEDIE
jgi:capsule polysaccharide export protein KpsE/RkpR